MPEDKQDKDEELKRLRNQVELLRKILIEKDKIILEYQRMMAKELIECQKMF